jgi:hypothetical protein
MLFGDNPDNGWPEAKNLDPARSVTIGFVKKKTTNKSTSVVKPNVNAKPRTPPTAKK